MYLSMEESIVSIDILKGKEQKNGCFTQFKTRNNLIQLIIITIGLEIGL
jgi:hypothetical protein